MRLGAFGWGVVLSIGLALAACGSGGGSQADGDSEQVSEDGDSDVTSEDGDQSEADSEPAVYPSEPDHRVVYELHGSPGGNRHAVCNRLPFPYDFFTKADATTGSGRRLNIEARANEFISCTNTVLLDSGLYLLSDVYVSHMNTLDGFSTFGAMMVEVSDVDAAGLPSRAVSGTTDSPILVVNLNKNSSKFGKPVEVNVERREALDDSKAHLFWYLWIRPVAPLEESSPYAIVIKRSLKASDGTGLQPSAHFQIVSGMSGLDSSWEHADLLQAEKTRLAPVLKTLLDASTGLNLKLDDIAIAIDFTTQSVTADMFYIEDQIKQGKLSGPAPTFDITGDGKADFYTFDTLSTFPTTDANFPDRTDIPGLDDDSDEWSTIGGAMRGAFISPDFRSPKSAATTERRADFQYDAQNHPVVQVADAKVAFTLYFPKDTFQQPFPVVIMQHGIYSKKEDMYGLMQNFLSLGYAVAMMDFPYHGERGDEGYGGISPLEFIDVSYPLKSRAAFVQATLDQQQFVRLFSSWTGDYYPNGTGDGKVDIDTTRIAYLGHSLGGIVGTLTMSMAPDLGAFVNIAGGGGLMDFIDMLLSTYKITSYYPEYQVMQFADIVQTVVEAGDNVNYARYIKDEPRDGAREKSYLIQEMEQDEVMPHRVTENDARLVGVPILNPVIHTVDGLTGQDGPLSRFGMCQFDPGTHQTIDQTHPETRARMVTQYQHFISTYFQSGAGEIIAVPASTR